MGRCEKVLPNFFLSIIAFFTLGIITVGTWSLSSKANSYIAIFHNQSGGLEIVLAACLFLIAKQNFDKEPRALGNIINQIANLTFTVYLSHITFIGFFLS